MPRTTTTCPAGGAASTGCPASPGAGGRRAGAGVPHNSTAQERLKGGPASAPRGAGSAPAKPSGARRAQRPAPSSCPSHSSRSRASAKRGAAGAPARASRVIRGAQNRRGPPAFGERGGFHSAGRARCSATRHTFRARPRRAWCCQSTAPTLTTCETSRAPSSRARPPPRSWCRLSRPLQIAWAPRPPPPLALCAQSETFFVLGAEAVRGVTRPRPPFRSWTSRAGRTG